MFGREAWKSKILQAKIGHKNSEQPNRCYIYNNIIIIIKMYPLGQMLDVQLERCQEGREKGENWETLKENLPNIFLFWWEKGQVACTC